MDTLKDVPAFSGTKDSTGTEYSLTPVLDNVCRDWELVAGAGGGDEMLDALDVDPAGVVPGRVLSAVDGDSDD